MTQPFDRKVAFDGRLVSVEKLSWTTDAGSAVEREVVRHPGAVLIIAEQADNQLVLIRNRRIAVDAVLWEFPAGTLEPGEPPAETAKRELIEETGYRCNRIQPLREFYTSPGFTDERMHVFHATDLVHIGQQLEPHEEIEVCTVPRFKLLQMMTDGTIVDGKSIAAMFLYQQLCCQVGSACKS